MEIQTLPPYGWCLSFAHMPVQCPSLFAKFKIFVVLLSGHNLTQDWSSFSLSLSFAGESDMPGLHACRPLFAMLLIMFVAILNSVLNKKWMEIEALPPVIGPSFDADQIWWVFSSCLTSNFIIIAVSVVEQFTIDCVVSFVWLYKRFIVIIETSVWSVM